MNWKRFEIHRIAGERLDLYVQSMFSYTMMMVASVDPTQLADPKFLFYLRNDIHNLIPIRIITYHHMRLKRSVWNRIEYNVRVRHVLQARADKHHTRCPKPKNNEVLFLEKEKIL